LQSCSRITAFGTTMASGFDGLAAPTYRLAELERFN
jgi:hypothetical protein